MKNFGKFLLAVALLIALPLTLAQNASNNGVPAYNVAQEQTFSGIIKEVKEYQCPVTGTVGAHISVAGDFTTLEVHLAPAKFLKDYEIVLKQGDRVTIRGIRFEFDGKPAMLARTVSSGQNTFTFRDPKGRPEW
ncbi:MAG TPA: hypothetical protein VJA94_25725 [Candidatus Angelobacter sp.]